MKLAGDSLKFESRSEVDELSVVLQEWLKTHQNDSKAKNVERAIDILEALYIAW